MGSGKTTVGRLLADQVGWRFADLDHEVEIRAGRTVPQIFAEAGEPAFRLAEVHALTGLLMQSQLVIALGGGAAGTAAIRQLLQSASKTAVVHLDAPFSVLYDRCSVQARDPEATSRPLLGNAAAAAERYVQRREIYAALADHQADASESPEQVAEAILKTLAAGEQTRG